MILSPLVFPEQTFLSTNIGENNTLMMSLCQMVETIGQRISQLADLESDGEESDESGSDFADDESDEGYHDADGRSD